VKLTLEKVHLDLKVNWKLSRNQTTFKENFIVHLESDRGQFRSEIAPNIRYGETTENILSQFESWICKVHLPSITSMDALAKSLPSDMLHALRFGLESVLLKYLAQGDLTGYLGLPAPVASATSFSMPIIPVGEIADYLKPLSRFKHLKIKVNAESATDMLAEIHKNTQAKLRVDANEGWSDLDEFMRFQATLKGMNIELIEQPFPSKLQSEYRALKKMTPFKLLADESIEDAANFQELSEQFHAINIKLMKTGSLTKARDLIKEAKANGLEIMMGCMIETTIGISYGMLYTGMVEYVDLDGFLLIKDEPYQLVTESNGILTLGH